jgi:hypothetical protein
MLVVASRAFQQFDADGSGAIGPHLSDISRTLKLEMQNLPLSFAF